MYSPKEFIIEDKSTIERFVLENSFATLISREADLVQVSHAPALFEKGTTGPDKLVLHLARANPHAKSMHESMEVLTVFQGPHAYISPSWYSVHPSVPTWNYTAVHIYGTPRIVADETEMEQLMTKLVEFYEAGRENRWDGVMPEEYRGKMFKAIVGIEISITRIEAKFKLSQNRPQDQMFVIEALEKSNFASDREAGKFMRKYYSEK